MHQKELISQSYQPINKLMILHPELRNVSKPVEAINLLKTIELPSPDNSLLVTLNQNYALDTQQIMLRLLQETMQRNDIESLGMLPSVILQPHNEYRPLHKEMVKDLLFVRDQWGVIATLTEIGVGPKMFITPRPAGSDDYSGDKAMSDILEMAQIMQDKYHMTIGCHDLFNSQSSSYFLVQRVPWPGREGSRDKDKRFMHVYDQYGPHVLAGVRAYSNGIYVNPDDRKLHGLYPITDNRRYNHNDIVSKGIHFGRVTDEMISHSLTSIDSEQYDLVRMLVNYPITPETSELIDVSGWRKQEFDVNASGGRVLSPREWQYVSPLSCATIATERMLFQGRLEELAERYRPYLPDEMYQQLLVGRGMHVSESGTIIYPDIFKALTDYVRSHGTSDISIDEISKEEAGFHRKTCQEILAMNINMLQLVNLFYQGVSITIPRGAAITYNSYLQMLQYADPDDAHYKKLMESAAADLSKWARTKIFNDSEPLEERIAAIDQLNTSDTHLSRVIQ
ncbi:MAG: hypothetical protein ACOCXQ_00985 [Patescibacteria group bacterium]